METERKINPSPLLLPAETASGAILRRRGIRRRMTLSLLLILALGSFVLGAVKEAGEARANPANLRWARASTTPFGPRDAAALVEFRERLWLVGGFSGDYLKRGASYQYWKMPHLNDVWSSGDGLNWMKEKEKADFPPRRSHSIIEAAGRLVMFGGWSPAGGYQSDIWTSSDGRIWRLAGYAPWPAREGQAVYQAGEVWYMTGGVNFDKRLMYNDVWRTPDGLNWSMVLEKAAWPPRYDHAVASLDGAAYLLGGLKLGGGTYGDIWTTSDGENWKVPPAAEPPPERHGHALLNYRGALYVLSGWREELSRGDEEGWMSEDGIHWRKLVNRLPWSGREDHAAAVFKDKIFIVGGMANGAEKGDGVWSNEIWYADFKL